MSDTDIPFYTFSEQDIYAKLQTSPEGLSDNEATFRLGQYGPNELTVKKKRTKFSIFLSQFKNGITYILLFAAVISLIVGKYINVVVILAVILINGLIGFIQEVKADVALSALQSMAAPEADVIRNCNQGSECIEFRLKARELVPGDLIIIEMGDKVPADARLIETVNLEVDESMLTGESLPVRKQLGIFPASAPLGDRKNLIYSGTLITAGRGRAIVIKTGMSTEMGKIAHLIDETEEHITPLQKRVDDLTKKLGILAIAMGILVFVIGILRGYEFIEMLLFGIATLVSSIPSGLPAAITITLAVGVQQMVKRHAIIRKLAAIDSLGAVTTIVTDKTGTLTTNQMTARKVFSNGDVFTITGIGYKPEGYFINEQHPDVKIESIEQDHALQTLLTSAILCNDSHLIQRELSPNSFHWEITGDPTEGALIVAGAKLHLQRENLRKQFPRIDEIPFDSKNRFMATFHNTNEISMNENVQVNLHLKGAPESILTFSDSIFIQGKITSLNSVIKDQILEISNVFAGQGLRVLGIASMNLPFDGVEGIKTSLLKFYPIKGLIFLGLIGIIDPPREEVKQAIKLCKSAGIHVIMATGDHKLTAKVIGEEIGIVTPNTQVLEGIELDLISDADLDKQIKSTTAFVRVSPVHKFRVVNSLRRQNELVAMTGDGANDAPALKAADIGIAMGIAGTDVTKETAKMVLTDDNFASIVNAIEEGRVVADNIKKGVKFLITTNIGEILTILLSIIFLSNNAPLFTALTILWVNLVTDGTLTIALAREPKEQDVMSLPPKSPNERILSKDLLFGVVFTGVIMAAGVLLISQFHGKDAFITEKQSLAFTALAFYQIVNAINCRSRTQSILSLGLWSNRSITIGIGISILLQILAVQSPFMNLILGTSPLSLIDWIIIGGGALTLLLAEEIRKIILRKQVLKSK